MLLELTGSNIILVEDMLYTGRTMVYLKKLLLPINPDA